MVSFFFGLFLSKFYFDPLPFLFVEEKTIFFWVALITFHRVVKK